VLENNHQHPFLIDAIFAEFATPNDAAPIEATQQTEKLLTADPPNAPTPTKEKLEAGGVERQHSTDTV
jgi:hypothetical protein